MAQRLRAALVDLDGTLVDTLGDFEWALARTLQALGTEPLSRAWIERTVGKGSEHLIRSALDQAGLPAHCYEEAWSHYQTHYMAINGEHAPLYPGVLEGLQQLARQGLRLVCLTNKPGSFARTLLERKGIHAHFERVVGGDAYERRKPDPMPLLESCKALGLAPADVLMVGDSANDAQAARAAGCPLVLVRYGYNHGEPIDEVPADAHIDRLDELFATPLR
jgi:phosphoglycolate phosphatase